MRTAFRICASVFGIVLATATASLGVSPEPTRETGTGLADLGPEAEPATPMACCKVCTKGKACGNSCIAKEKDCHQPPGCACDG